LSSAANKLLTIEERPTNPSDVLSARKKSTCTVCTTNPKQPVMIEEGWEWERHEQSKSHRYMAGREAKMQRTLEQGDEKRAARKAAREGKQGVTQVESGGFQSFDQSRARQ